MSSALVTAQLSQKKPILLTIDTQLGIEVLSS